MRPDAPSAPTGRRRPQVVIGALGVTQILAWGSSYYLPAVLAAPISADTGWPLAWVVGGLSIGLLVAGVISPRVGHLIYRHGGRPVLAAGSLLLAVGLLLLGLAPSLPVFLVGWLLLGAGMGASLYDSAFSTLGRHFGAAARPAITTLTLWGGFASTVSWPLSAWLVAHVGWRGACLTYAALQIGIALPLILAFVPRLPGLLQAETSEPATVRIRPAERRAFLLFAAIQTLGGIITSMVAVHLLTLLQARDLTLAAAVSLGALMGPSQVAARIVEMAGRGRHHPLWTLTGAAGLTALGLLLLWLAAPIAAAAVVLYGAGNGVASIARGTVPLALFGAARYASLMGRVARPSLIAQAIAPSIGAFALAHAGAEVTLAGLVLIGIVNAILVAALWRAAPRMGP